jgi:hypothetical protein
MVCGSVVEHLPSIHDDLDLIPSTTKNSKSNHPGLVPVVHACNPSYSATQDHGLKSA